MQDYMKELIPPSPESVVQQHGIRLKRQKVILIAAILSGILYRVTLGRRGSLTFQDIGISSDQGLLLTFAALLVFFGLTYWNWRCPACDKFLWLNLHLKRCPGCKASFEPKD